ncbi:hypothetical protein BUY70_01650 [Staphylococcus epidermidis]|uniref:hypothetical protein n=1 Tax=Staphylococcus epidermidis TaxID=1282 RepID=UPI000E6A3717|nr:hypothetical protein [Staphylococcus epidermidis]RIL61736.1 hypothetical protein BUY70_01650 [Staphylococcus epidermidis]
MKNNIISKLLMSAVVLTGSVAGINTIHTDSAQASEKQESTENTVKIQPINQSQANIKLNKNISYKISDNGNAKLIDKSTGKTEELPTKTKDKNGKPVILAYEKDGNNLKLDVINEDKSTQTRGWKKGLKCGLGTAGTAGGGGLAGASAGSAVPGIGTAAGGIVGTVSGGMAGAAASCF